MENTSKPWNYRIRIQGTEKAALWIRIISLGKRPLLFLNLLNSRKTLFSHNKFVFLLSAPIRSRENIVFIKYRKVFSLIDNIYDKLFK